jgi:hypothetical protein
VPLHAAERDGAHAFPHVLGPPDLLAVDALLLALPQPAPARVWQATKTTTNQLSSSLPAVRLLDTE